MKRTSHTCATGIHPTLKYFDELPNIANVSIDVVCGIYGCSPATAWRRVRSGELIAPHRIGARTTRWNVGELRHALNEEAK